MRNPLPGPPALATLVLQEQPSRPFTPEAPSPTRATLVCDHIGLRKSRFFSARFSHMQKTVTLLEKNKLQQFQKGRGTPWQLAVVLDVAYYHSPSQTVVANGQRKERRGEQNGRGLVTF